MRSNITLALSVLLLAFAGCGGSDDDTASTAEPPAAEAPAAEPSSGGGAVAIAMKSIRFNPETVSVKVGQTVKWTNEESVDHNVVADSGASFKSKNFNRGGTYSFKATKPGTVKYECTLHPGMVGTLTIK